MLINIALSPNTPVTNLDQHHYLSKIILFLVIESVYISYIYSTHPHTQSMYNRLEIFNETSLIILAYLMICYSGVMEQTA